MKDLTLFCLLIVLVIFCIAIKREIERIETPQPPEITTCERYGGLSFPLPTT